jgi:predicted XRE-type DNA-binding protein
MGSKKFDSVWDALETSEEAAANMKMRAELMIALENHIGSKEMTQAEMAATFGITQPRLNDLLRGRIQKFSLDALVNLAIRAGLRVDVKVRRAA